MKERSERCLSKTSFSYKRIIRNLIKLDNVTAIAHIKRLFFKGGGVIMAQSTSKINLGLVSNQSNFLGCRIYTRCSNSRLGIKESVRQFDVRQICFQSFRQPMNLLLWCKVDL